jgi:hypothetical protein
MCNVFRLFTFSVHFIINTSVSTVIMHFCLLLCHILTMFKFLWWGFIFGLWISLYTSSNETELASRNRAELQEWPWSIFWIRKQKVQKKVICSFSFHILYGLPSHLADVNALLSLLFCICKNSEIELTSSSTYINFLEYSSVSFTVSMKIASCFTNTWLIIIQFNSILYYLCAESTATRPITDTAQYRYT